MNLVDICRSHFEFVKILVANLAQRDLFFFYTYIVYGSANICWKFVERNILNFSRK